MKTLPAYNPKVALSRWSNYDQSVSNYGPAPEGYRWLKSNEIKKDGDIYACGHSKQFETVIYVGQKVNFDGWPVARPAKAALPDVGREFRDHYTEGEGGISRIAKIDSVLADPVKNRGAILSCFSWSLTPQGHQYWWDREIGIRPFSKADLDYLKAVKIYFSSKKEKKPKITIASLQTEIAALKEEVSRLNAKISGAKITFPA